MWCSDRFDFPSKDGPTAESDEVPATRPQQIGCRRDDCVPLVLVPPARARDLVMVSGETLFDGSLPIR